MNTLGALNRALKYVEDNLTGEIDFREVARLAMTSEYHFKRMFSFFAGVTLSEYIRRRRLTLAAFELQTTGQLVIDVALKYGYDSPDAFTRAFKALHGITPSEARQPGQAFKAFPRMTFQLTIRGGGEMNYRIVEKDAFRIVGVMKRVPLIYRGENPEITALWKELGREGIERLKPLSNVEPSGIIQVSANFSEGRYEHGELDQWIGVATTHEAPEGFSEMEVEASTWAVFESVGPYPDTIQNLWAQIFAEWFPSSGYELGQGLEILWTEHLDITAPDFRSEIWVPVVKKNEG